MTWKHFSEKEVEGLSLDLVDLLDKAREIAGIPFVITSGFRVDKENQAVGGVDHSAHANGTAVDLACSISPDRFKMLKSLLQVGFNRIGVYDRHIHADVDLTKDQNVIWWGISH